MIARKLRLGTLVGLLGTLVASCALTPVYSGGGTAGVAQGLDSIEVPAIQGRAGWLMRNALNDRLGAGTGAPNARYRLDVRLDDNLESLAILNDDTISRERRILRARYQLVDLTDNSIVVDATAGSDAGIDVVSSEYATIAAEERALENLTLEVADQIVLQLALELRGAR